MTGVRAAIGKVAGMLLPWTPKHEREEAIASARAEKERSQASAARAAVIVRQIEHAREENSFAAAITRAFRGEGGAPR